MTSRYYAYRLKEERKESYSIGQDSRMQILQSEWFEGKKCWDIGCNTGELTVAMARAFEPAYLLGTDLDLTLIHQARNNIKKYYVQLQQHLTGSNTTVQDILEHNQNHPAKSEFHKAVQSWTERKDLNTMPLSFQLWNIQQQAPKESTTTLPDVPLGLSASGLKFPYNIVFQRQDIVQDYPTLVKASSSSRYGESYDTICCFSVTKWIHLYHGDAGIKTLFQIVYDNLMPGGKFILEPQPWKSYHKRRYMSDVTARHYAAIELRPKDFQHYLLTTQHFRTCEFLQRCETAAKGFRRPVYVFTK